MKDIKYFWNNLSKRGKLLLVVGVVIAVMLIAGYAR